MRMGMLPNASDPMAKSHACCNVFELYVNPEMHKMFIVKILRNWHEF